METRGVSIYSTEGILKKYIADIESCRKERLEIHGVIRVNGSYFVDYSYRNKDGVEVTHVGLEVEPLELMDMLNNKLNDLLETLNND